MKKAIIGFTMNPPMRASSHTAGWVQKWSELLNADVLPKYNLETLKEYDDLYIFNDINGVEGKVNIFGFKPDNEVGQQIKDRIEILEAAVSAGIGLKQLDYAQTYATCLAKRKMADVPQWFDDIPHVVQTQYSNKVVVGDSHSISVAPEGYAVIRNDGKTLYGALKEGLSSYITENTTDVIFKFGDIDMRHHICRQDDPVAAVKELTSQYLLQAGEIAQAGANVSLCFTMPQTTDDRKIPKTGYFKGTPFYGDVSERNMIGKLFNTIISLEWSDVITYPEEYFDDKFLDQSKMEAGGSFHLAPHSYLKETTNDG